MPNYVCISGYNQSNYKLCVWGVNPIKVHNFVQKGVTNKGVEEIGLI